MLHLTQKMLQLEKKKNKTLCSPFKCNKSCTKEGKYHLLDRPFFISNPFSNSLDSYFFLLQKLHSPTGCPIKSCLHEVVRGIQRLDVADYLTSFFFHYLHLTQQSMFFLYCSTSRNISFLGFKLCSHG